MDVPYFCRMKKNICLLFLMVVFLCACKKPVNYSDIPEIKFISFHKYQDTQIQDGAILTFSFKDGDGDIGLHEWETYPPFDSTSIYYYNFFCDYYEKQKGVFVKIDFNLNARIPRLSKLQKESIHGEIYLTLPFYYDITSPYTDTIQLKFNIVDRKLNKSNTETIIIDRTRFTIQSLKIQS